MPIYTFNSPGLNTFSPPPDATQVTIQCWGGGGAGGGGGIDDHVGDAFAGGGGGGGAYASSSGINMVGTAVSMVVGGGGVGRTSDGAGGAGDGTDGAYSAVLIAGVTTVKADGGYGGKGGNSNAVAGGLGGLAANCLGQVIRRGGSGSLALYLQGQTSANTNYGGPGGGAGRVNGIPDPVVDAMFTFGPAITSGNSGGGGVGAQPVPGALGGGGGQLYGGGGGGASAGNSVLGPAGASAGWGLVIISWGVPVGVGTFSPPGVSSPGMIASTGRFMTGIRIF